MVNNQDYSEWDASRKLIDKFDQHIVELRKYGFTFITGLLAVQGIFTPVIPPNTKLAIIILSLTLILAVALFEQNLTIMQKAAVQRAIILERRLNLELTELISYQYILNQGNNYKYSIYVLFLFGTCLLAYALPINSDPLYNLVIVIFLFIFSILALYRFYGDYRYRYKITEGVEDKEIIKSREDIEDDWTVDKVVCYKGDEVGITLTNLNEKKPIKAGRMGEINKEKDKGPMGKPIPLELFDNIDPQRYYTWFLNTEDWEEGTYKIYPENRCYPLQRKIRIMKKEEE